MEEPRACSKCTRELGKIVVFPSVLKVLSGCTVCGNQDLKSFSLKEIEKQQGMGS